jgi:hypothetical protein
MNVEEKDEDDDYLNEEQVRGRGSEMILSGK